MVAAYPATHFLTLETAKRQLLWFFSHLRRWLHLFSGTRMLEVSGLLSFQNVE